MIQNKKAFHNYNVKETLEVGISLTGAEVKSIRDNRANISDAFVKVMSGEMYLINADIAKYKHSGEESYDSTRSRKLLLHRKELEMLQSKSKQGGYTLIPLKIYFVRGRVKVLIALARGKKSYQKKATEKERTLDRELLRERRKFVI